MSYLGPECCKCGSIRCDDYCIVDKHSMTKCGNCYGRGVTIYHHNLVWKCDRCHDGYILKPKPVCTECAYAHFGKVIYENYLR